MIRRGSRTISFRTKVICNRNVARDTGLTQSTSLSYLKTTTILWKPSIVHVRVDRRQGTLPVVARISTCNATATKLDTCCVGSSTAPE